MCNKSFSRKGTMTTHVALIHENKKFQCDLCDYRLSLTGDMIRYVTTVHEKKKKKLSLKS